MKTLSYVAPSLFLFYAIYFYTTPLNAVLIVAGFLLPLASNIYKTYWFHNILPITALAICSLIYSSLWYFTVGYVLQVLLAIFERGVPLFKPFTSLNVHYKVKNLERNVLIGSIIGIILMFFQ
jgi:phosphoglycerol transferase MdoB-like AlkP superfamily enzyme